MTSAGFSTGPGGESLEFQDSGRVVLISGLLEVSFAQGRIFFHAVAGEVALAHAQLAVGIVVGGEFLVQFKGPGGGLGGGGLHCEFPLLTCVRLRSDTLPLRHDGLSIIRVVEISNRTLGGFGRAAVPSYEAVVGEN